MRNLLQYEEFITGKTGFSMTLTMRILYYRKDTFSLRNLSQERCILIQWMNLVLSYYRKDAIEYEELKI